MNEDFDVKLVENAKYYTPDVQYRRDSWIGDYETAYEKFLSDPEAFWAGVARELEWKRPWERSWNGTIPMRNGSLAHTHITETARRT